MRKEKEREIEDIKQSTSLYKAANIAIELNRVLLIIAMAAMVYNVLLDLPSKKLLFIAIGQAILLPLLQLVKENLAKSTSEKVIISSLEKEDLKKEKDFDYEAYKDIEKTVEDEETRELSLKAIKDYESDNKTKAEKKQAGVGVTSCIVIATSKRLKTEEKFARLTRITMASATSLTIFLTIGLFRDLLLQWGAFEIYAFALVFIGALFLENLLKMGGCLASLKREQKTTDILLKSWEANNE